MLLSLALRCRRLLRKGPPIAVREAVPRPRAQVQSVQLVELRHDPLRAALVLKPTPCSRLRTLMRVPRSFPPPSTIFFRRLCGTLPVKSAHCLRIQGGVEVLHLSDLGIKIR